MRDTITITKLTCDRCKKEVQSLTTLYKKNPRETYNSYCDHLTVGDLCETCHWEFQNFMDGLL